MQSVAGYLFDICWLFQTGYRLDYVRKTHELPPALVPAQFMASLRNINRCQLFYGTAFDDDSADQSGSSRQKADLAYFFSTTAAALNSASLTDLPQASASTSSFKKTSTLKVGEWSGPV